MNARRLNSRGTNSTWSGRAIPRADAAGLGPVWDRHGTGTCGGELIAGRRGSSTTMFRLGVGFATTALTLSMLAAPLGGAAAQPAKKGAPAAKAAPRAGQLSL